MEERVSRNHSVSTLPVLMGLSAVHASPFVLMGGVFGFGVIALAVSRSIPSIMMLCSELASAAAAVSMI